MEFCPPTPSPHTLTAHGNDEVTGVFFFLNAGSGFPDSSRLNGKNKDRDCVNALTNWAFFSSSEIKLMTIRHMRSMLLMTLTPGQVIY